MRIEGIFRVPIVGGVKFGELLFFLLLALANGTVFFHFMQSIPDINTTQELVARAMGHVICLNFAVLIVLPQRNSIWVWIFGISVERMIKYHRIMGRILFTAISGHLIMFWWLWISTKNIYYTPNSTYALMTASIIGHATWFCVFVILVTSLEYFRRSKFELFFYTHHLFLAVVGLAVYHTYLTQKWNEDMLIYWLIPGIIMYVVDLITRSWRARGATRLLSVVRDEGTNIMLVKLHRKNFRFQPGQYVYLNVPAVSFFEWHPFSITSAPSESTPRDSIVTVAIRNMGPKTWTGKLQQLFDETLLLENIKVRMEGPYGTLSIDLYQYPILVLIAGGIGIAPLIAMLTEYNNNPSLAFEKLYFLWCAKHQDFLIPFSDILQTIEMNDMLGKLDIQRFATRDMEAATRRRYSIMDASQRGLSLNGRLATAIPEQFTPGRPVLRDFFSRLVTKHPSARIGVVACGPKMMADDVAKTCAYFNRRRGPQIDLHRESFEL